MFKIYGSEMCPDCVACKVNFDKCGVDYEFVDINKNLRDMAEFLQYRDENPVFDHCKEIGDIGLPALMREDGSIFLDWEGYLKERGFSVEWSEMKTQACSLDKRGC